MGASDGYLQAGGETTCYTKVFQTRGRTRRPTETDEKHDQDSQESPWHARFSLAVGPVQPLRARPSPCETTRAMNRPVWSRSRRAARCPLYGSVDRLATLAPLLQAAPCDCSGGRLVTVSRLDSVRLFDELADRFDKLVPMFATLRAALVDLMRTEPATRSSMSAAAAARRPLPRGARCRGRGR